MKEDNSALSRLIWIGLAIACVAIFTTILWFAYLGKLPPALTQNDKLAHLVLYGIITLVGHRALSRRRICLWQWRVPLFPMLFSFFTVGEELVQGLSPNRSLDAIDLVASFVGIAIGFWLAERSWKR